LDTLGLLSAQLASIAEEQAEARAERQETSRVLTNIIKASPPSTRKKFPDFSSSPTSSKALEDRRARETNISKQEEALDILEAKAREEAQMYASFLDNSHLNARKKSSARDVLSRPSFKEPTVTEAFRRNSLAMKENRDEEDISSSNPRHRETNLPQAIHVHQALASSTHIRLSQLTADKVIKFEDDLQMYEEEHGVKLKAFAHVSRDVRELLISSPSNQLLMLPEFCGLSKDAIIKICRDFIKPKTCADFAKKLRAACRPDGFTLNTADIEHWPTFHADIARYCQLFLRVFKFLATHNEENIPKCENKDEGSIKIFMSNFEKEFRESVMTQLRISHGSNIESFIMYIFIPFATDLANKAVTAQYLLPFAAKTERTPAAVKDQKESSYREASGPRSSSPADPTRKRTFFPNFKKRVNSLTGTEDVSEQLSEI